ncbi:dTDP-fucopyranose mutase [Marasmius crinis-equi]|uniref:dTDP-fucopyranose mutase n=1 Tax=Marasmius crinis-equi TaxID=585013 RepID=A0ABR3FZX6_9AGAR
MSFTATEGKGKERAIDLTDHESESESDSSSDPESSSTSDSSDEEITEEYLESLLEQARQNLKQKSETSGPQEEELIVLQKEESALPLPPLDPGPIPEPYFQLGKDRNEGSSLRDPDAELADKKASILASVPAPPIRPPELSKSGKPITKRERKELRNKTAGPDWFDMSASSEADLPRLHREVEAMRLRNQLDPKRFYRKDEGEGKGIKGLPKHFAMGTIVATSTPFGGSSGQNLTRAEKKRTLVDELVDDAEAKRYAKKKFQDLQGVRGAKGRNTLHVKNAARRKKW